jgi:hypothetical protein
MRVGFENGPGAYKIVKPVSRKIKSVPAVGNIFLKPRSQFFRPGKGNKRNVNDSPKEREEQYQKNPDHFISRFFMLVQHSKTDNNADKIQYKISVPKVPAGACD